LDTSSSLIKTLSRVMGLDFGGDPQRVLYKTGRLTWVLGKFGKKKMNGFKNGSPLWPDS